MPLIVVAALLVPVLLIGLAFEDQVLAWVTSERPPLTQFVAVVATLASDILLPIPSSGVSTYAGGTLGAAWGTLASWVGMTLGAAAGFGLARWFGRPFADRIGGRDTALLADFAERYGGAALFLTRPFPLLAEACVLLAGTSHMPWRTFALPVLGCNLLISAAYATAGAYFRGRDLLPQALIASVLVPVTLAFMIRAVWSRRPAR